MNKAAITAHRQLLAPAVATAVVLGGAAVTFVIDVVAVQTDHRSVVWPYMRLAHDLRTTTWSGAAAIAITTAVAVVGLLLIILALRPAPATHLVLRAERPGDTIYIAPRSVRRAVEHATVAVEGVDSALVTMHRDRLQVVTSSAFRDSTGVEQAVRTAASTCLDHLELAHPPHVDVAVSHPETIS